MENKTEVSNFIAWMRLKKLREKTIGNYLYYYRKFGSWNNLNKNNMELFLGKHNNSICQAFFVNYKNYLLEHREDYPPDFINLLLDLRMIKVRRGREKIPSFLNIEDIKRLENQMTSERNKLMLLITFYGGLRLNELMNIGYSDSVADIKNKALPEDIVSLKVTSEMGKGGKERYITLPSDVALRFKKWLYSSSLEKNNLWGIGKRRWQIILQDAGVKALNKKVHPHTIRHSLATHLLKNPNINLREIQEYLGHSSIQTTQVYTHINQAALKLKLKDSFMG